MPAWYQGAWAGTVWDSDDSGSSAQTLEDGSGYYVRVTQPWECAMNVTAGEVIQYRFPQNFGTLKFMAYDREPIMAMSKKLVQSRDASYVTREGRAMGYYPLDGVDMSYVLYPKPSVNWVNELEGDGVAITVSDDTEDGDEGTIAVRSGDGDVSTGVSIDAVDVDDSVFMVYSVSPTPLSTAQDEPDFPDYLRKYVRYGVAARAYGANTDGRIKSLAEYWQMRYDLGVRFIKRFMRLRRQDRDYRMTTKGMTPRNTYRHPRLPDGYPAT